MPSLPSKWYDFLKYLDIVVLPAIGALYAGLSQIWTLPYASEVPATITVICTFLGAILCISTAQYNLLQKDFTDFPPKEDEEDDIEE